MLGFVAAKKKKKKKKKKKLKRKVIVRPAPKPKPAPVRYIPRAFTAQPVPSAYELHVIKRLGTGYTAATLGAVRAAGGIDAWFDRQLDPASVPEAPIVAQVDAWFSSLRRTPAQKFASNADRSLTSYTYGEDLADWTILRRVYSNRMVHETMVDFWTNHLHISTGDDRAYVHQFDYDATIRKHALGRFEDLLVAASTHPAMSLYLDNWRSQKGAPNENQGRELLELHTVGAAAGYTEEMVKHSAIILSGYSVRWSGSIEGFYDSANHTTGAVKVLDFTHPNTAADGRPVAEAYLRYLAHHPATAANVAKRMAIRFVSDTPSSALVDHLAGVYLSSGTDIRATLKALVAHPEFRASAGAKVSTPVDDLVATLRAVGAVVRQPSGAAPFANALNYMHGGLRLYSWPRPDGAPETNAEWTSAVRMLRSFRMHWNLSAGSYPQTAVSYYPAVGRIPAQKITFDLYFDRLSRQFLGRGSTARSLEAACLATGLVPLSVVTPSHGLATWLFPHVAAVLLDSPEHMTR